MGLLLRRALVAVWPGAERKYRPEKHYMRGPGPKTLSMIGRRLRAESEKVTQEPFPPDWLHLIHSLAERDRRPAQNSTSAVSQARSDNDTQT